MSNLWFFKSFSQNALIYVSSAAALITPRPQINEGIGFSFDSYLSSQRTIFPKETFFLEKLSLEEHKMEISSTKIFALWEFFVNIFIISYYNNSKVFPFAMLTATNTKLQGLSKENAQSQNFS